MILCQNISIDKLKVKDENSAGATSSSNQRSHLVLSAMRRDNPQLTSGPRLSCTWLSLGWTQQQDCSTRRQRGQYLPLPSRPLAAAKPHVQ